MAVSRLPSLQEEERMAAYTSARRQDLLKVQGKKYGQDCLYCTDAGGIDPVVVVVMEAAEGEAVPAVLVCGFEGICSLQNRQYQKIATKGISEQPKLTMTAADTIAKAKQQHSESALQTCMALELRTAHSCLLATCKSLVNKGC